MNAYVGAAQQTLAVCSTELVRTMRRDGRQR